MYVIPGGRKSGSVRFLEFRPLIHNQYSSRPPYVHTYVYTYVHSLPRKSLRTLLSLMFGVPVVRHRAYINILTESSLCYTKYLHLHLLYVWRLNLT